MLQNLSQVISTDKLHAYRRNSEDGDLDLFVRYLFNVAVCESLYTSLHFLEIVLRNKIDCSFTAHFGPNWLCASSFLGLLRSDDIKKIEDTKKMLTDRNRQPVQPGLLAELSFGFWVSLFDACYEITLWHNLIKPTFPNMATDVRRRKTISKRMEGIRKLRNRVFHYKRITHLELARLHLEIVEAVSWMNTNASLVLRSICKFTKLWQSGENAFKDSLNGKIPPII